MKSKKLTIKSLEVQSFVTSFDTNESMTVKGGETRGSCGIVCPIGPPDDTMDNNCTGPIPSYQPGGTCGILCWL